MSIYNEYQPTIGIECHVQLATKTKLFSASDNDARNKKPNTCVNEIDFGLPGMLPVLNKKAVELAVKAGTALNTEIAHISRFDRKHYFYPDLPKGYQTSQLYQPIIGPGKVEISLSNGEKKVIKIHHAHLEEDAGKLTHHSEHSWVDLNRAGTPLIEIVSEPDMHSAEEAKAYVQELYGLMTYAGVTFGDLYHGNMRFDVNISVAKKDAAELGTRTETKNLNSFKSVERVVEYECKRQVDLIEKGEKIIQETRGWDDAKQKTFSQRSKEEAQDYRYMPDPDIPPIVLDQTAIDAMIVDMPLLPPSYRDKWQSMKLDNSVVTALLADQKIAEIITEVQREAGDILAKRIANLYASGAESDTENQGGIDTARLIELATMLEDSKLNSTAGKEIFNDMLSGNDADPHDIAKKKGLIQESDESVIIAIVEKVLSDPAAAQAVADIKAGNDKAIGFLVGLVMKESRGKANPSLAQRLIKERLAYI
jgi:aspartyl-tRNA(Asn)/glutamyl-tRNA(Gln) amidotransferase subunit B